MTQERDDAVQAIRLIPVRAILRQNRFDLPPELYKVAYKIWFAERRNYSISKNFY